MNISSEFINKKRRDESGGIFSAILEPSRSRKQVVWTAAIGAIIVVLFGFIIKSTHFDLAVVQQLNHVHHGVIGSLTNGVYKFFGPTFAILGTIILTVLIVVISKSLRIGSAFAATVAATWLSLALVKLIVHRVRPDPSLLSFPFDPAQVDASYPSGHAAFVTALVVTLFLSVAVGYRRWIVGIVGGLIVLGVGTALVINGVHYPSDVLGSIVWGITVAPLAQYVWVSIVLKYLKGTQTERQH